MKNVLLEEKNIKLWGKWNFVENKTEIMQRLLQIGQHCSINCTCISFERENNVLQWEFQLKSVLTTAENWKVKGCMINVKGMYFKFIFKMLHISRYIWWAVHIIYMQHNTGTKITKTILCCTKLTRIDFLTFFKAIANISKSLQLSIQQCPIFGHLPWKSCS